ncbi:hypothetical protein [Gemmata sp.]|uniref:hypothetical protein n=1 Tax=Gemmata sp. TaxID=1914242 RepID=UPI003F727CED
MNAALLVLTSALGAGGDVVPAGWGEAPPAIIQAGGCACAAPAPSCDPCASKPKLLDRIKARCAPKCKAESAPACDACAAPAPACDACSKEKIGFFDKLKAHCAKKKESAPACDACAAPAPACDTCDPCAEKKKIGFFDKLKAHFAKKKECAPACDTCGTVGAAPVAGCATPGPVVTPPATKDAPKEMPKVKDAPKDAPKGISLPLPPAAAPAPVTLPALPVVPSSGIKLSTPNSPY